MQTHIMHSSIEKAIRYIDKNLSKPISLNEVSKECGMSKFHFSRTFKAVTGITFKTYHNIKRVQAAKDLLKNRENRVTDICYALGFNDASYFNKVFRKHEGMSPSSYKKQLRSLERPLFSEELQKKQNSPIF